MLFSLLININQFTGAKYTINISISKSNINHFFLFSIILSKFNANLLTCIIFIYIFVTNKAVK